MTPHKGSAGAVDEERIAIVLGTRPEIVKLAPLIKALAAPPIIVHTGQHYDANMAGVFFKAFGLERPQHELRVGGSSRGQQIGTAITGLDALFEELTPTAVVAQGDTNSTMSAAIAANAQSIAMIHVEAGLRSHDRRMPEEHNRIVTDHLSDLCLAPTEMSAANLRSEGIPDSRIRITGNTVVDAVRHLIPDELERSEIARKYGVQPGEFVLSTFHRPENVDSRQNLQTIAEQLAALGMPVLLPIHPRTRAMAQKHGIDLEIGGVRLLDPLDYIEFLGLLAECALAVADSGGLQEEVSVLKKPMVVVRNSTERPEVLGTFCTLVQVGEEISASGQRWLRGDPFSPEALAAIESPYGSGDAGERSVEAIMTFLRNAG